MTQGDIYTAAGNGTTDNTSSGASASATQLSQPDDVVVDVSGNVLTTDTGNNEVRVEANATGTFWGVAMTSGDVYTLAGNGTSGYSGDGGVSTSSVLDYPTGLTLDSSGNIVISDTENDIVRVVAKSNGTYFGIGMTAGHIYRIAGNLNFGYSGNGSSATAATLGLPTGVAIDASGNLIMADTYNSALRVVANTNGTYYGVAMTAGDIYTIAGTGSPGYSGDGSAATSATMSLPSGVTIDGAGNILVSDSSNNVIRVVADSTGTYYGVAMTAGDIYTIAGTGSQGYSGDGSAATSAKLSNPTGIAVDGSNDVIVADTANNVLRVVAGFTGSYDGQSVTAGDIYTLAGNGTQGYVSEPTTWAATEFSTPQGIALNGSGDLFVADTFNNRVRELTP